MVCTGLLFFEKCILPGSAPAVWVSWPGAPGPHSESYGLPYADTCMSAPGPPKTGKGSTLTVLKGLDFGTQCSDELLLY